MKRNKNRFLMVLIMALLVLTMSACQKDEPSQNGNNVTPTEAVTVSNGTETTGTAEAVPTDKVTGNEPEPTAAVTPAAEPEVTAAPTPELKETGAKFTDAAAGYVFEGSSELLNIRIGSYPVSEDRAVFQFGYYEAAEDTETVTDINYSCTMTLKNDSNYVYEGTGSDGNPLVIIATMEADENVSVSVDGMLPCDFNGSYYPADGGPVPDAETIIEYLRNVPSAEIGDFSSENEGDVVEESMVDGWFHVVSLFRNNAEYKTFIATDDMTGFCEMNGDSVTMLSGSMESTLGQVNYGSDEADDDYEVYENDETEYVDIELPLVYPYIQGGSLVAIGEVTEIAVEASFDLVESVEVSSSDENVISVNGREITGVADGEAILTVTLVYGGSTKEYSIFAIVAEVEEQEIDDGYENSSLEVASFADVVLQRATMDIIIEEDVCCVDIYWDDDAWSVHHWNYIGLEDEEDENVINLVGSCNIETYDEEGNCTETPVFENMTGTLTLGDDGYLYWYDSYQDAGADCKFAEIE